MDGVSGKMCFECPEGAKCEGKFCWPFPGDGYWALSRSGDSELGHAPLGFGERQFGSIYEAACTGLATEAQMRTYMDHLRLREGEREGKEAAGENDIPGLRVFDHRSGSLEVATDPSCLACYASPAPKLQFARLTHSGNVMSDTA